MCRTASLTPRTPLSRAASQYGVAAASATEALSNLVATARPTALSVSTGRISACGTSSGVPPSGTTETRGRISSHTASTATSRAATTNSGTAARVWAAVETIRSPAPPRRPVHRPSSVASGAVTARVSPARSRLFGRRVARTSVTGRSPTKPRPRSPRTAPATQSAYRAAAGRSRPSSARTSARCASEASTPATALTASPGRTVVAAKITADSRTSSTAAPARRRPAKAARLTRATPGRSRGTARRGRRGSR